MQLARSVLRLAGLALLAASAASLGLALWLAQGTLWFSAGVERATGRVVDYRTTPQADGRALYTPLVEFTARDGQRRVFAGQLSAGAKRFPAGSAVPVVYRVADPSAARIDLFVDNALGPLAALLAGVATLVAGIVLARRNGSTG